MNTKYFLLQEKNVKSYNDKCNDLINLYFIKKFLLVEINIENIENFFCNIINPTIILYYYHGFTPFINKILNVMNNYKNENIKLYIFTFDYWYYQDNSLFNIEYNKYINNVFKATNYKVICFANDIDELNFFLDYDYSHYKDNIIFNNIWSCYKTSFCEFNQKPIQKLLISGSRATSYYKERSIIAGIKSEYIEIYNKNMNDIKTINNNYNKTLNKYFSSFTSSVHIPVKNKSEFTNTHVILLKTFEILASGSLLVMPISEEKYIEKIGLKHNINCYLIDFNKNLNEQINYIFQNYDYYNNVRLKGNVYAKEHLNSEKKYIEIKNILSI